MPEEIMLIRNLVDKMEASVLRSGDQHDFDHYRRKILGKPPP
jgi:hypothetical protein